MSRVPPPVPIETLLRHRDWLRALIRDLVPDPGLAEDVEQATWLTAVAHPPRHRKGLSAWLAAVARSRLSDLGRAERRRKRREEAVAGPEAQPDVSDLIARAELQRTVVDAVLALEEPYRTVVLQRYFDDRPPRAIAAALGVPVETVRTRLKRAHEQLRGRLDGSYDGDRRAWVLAGLPLLHPGGMSALVHGLVRGVLLMSTKKLAVALVVALLLLGTGFVAYRVVGLGDAPEDARPDATDRAALERARGPDPIAGSPRLAGSQPTGAETADGAGSPPAAGAWAVSGRARDAEWHPLPALTVRARRFRGYLGSREWTDHVPDLDERLVTDAKGRFTWPMKAPTEPWTLVFSVEGEQAVSYPDTERVGPGQPPPSVVLLVRLLDHTVTGRVTDRATGAGLPEARVFLWGLPPPGVRTGPDGSYALRAPARRDGSTVGAVAAGYAVQRATVSFTSHEATTLDFALLPETLVVGRVTNEQGEAVAGATLWQGDLPRDLSIRSGEDGRYELHGVRAGESGATLMVSHPRYASTYVALSWAVSTPGSPVVRDVVLSRGAALEGLVLGPKGVPVEGACVTYGFAEAAWNAQEAWTDAQGHFRFENAEPGFMILVARAPGYGTTSFQTRVYLDTRSLPTLRLSEEQVLEGIVTDTGGAPVANAWIGADVEKTSVGGAFADDSGAFRIGSLPPGSVKLSVYARGFERKELADVATGRRDLRIALRPSAGFAGLVLDAITGKPVEEFQVRIVGGSGYAATWYEGHSFRSPEGRWTTGDTWFTEGQELTFVVRAEGHAPAVVTAKAVVSPEASPLTIRVGRGATVAGTIRAEDGAPVAGASVTLAWTGSDASSEARVLQEAFPPGRTTTDAEGRFALYHVPSGSLTLSVEAEGFGPVRDTAIAAQDDRRTEREIVLARGSWIEGHVVDRGGRPRAALGIYLSNTANDPHDIRSWEAKTDAEGRFRIGGLPGGTFIVSLVVERPGITSFWETSLRVELEEGAGHEVSFRREGSATVEGRLTGAPHVPRDAVVILEEVTAEGSLPSRTERTTPVDGAFRFEGVREGLFRVRVDHTDWPMQQGYVGSQEIRVPPSGDLHVDLEVTAVSR